MGRAWPDSDLVGGLKQKRSLLGDSDGTPLQDVAVVFLSALDLCLVMVERTHHRASSLICPNHPSPTFTPFQLQL